MPRKKWGQNFLLDENLHKKIVSYASLADNEVVLEIGCGLGHLTNVILSQGFDVWGVEIDPQLCQIVRQRFQGNSRFHLLPMDVLDSKHALNSEMMETLKPIFSQKPYKIVANLPYSVAAPVIINFLENPQPPAQIVVTVQREVAERFTASPGSKDYGPVTIHAMLYGFVQQVLEIHPECFFPKPKVYSTVLQIKPHPLPGDVQNITLLKNIVASVFNMRRKTILNALRHVPSLNVTSEQTVKVLESLGIPIQQRAERMELKQFISLSNLLAAYLKEE